MTDNNLIGIDDNWPFDLGVGIISGLFFVAFYASTSISMGIPAPIYIQSVGNIVNFFAGLSVVCLLASICEESIMAAILYITNEVSNEVVAVILTSIAFAALHWQVYGEAMMGAYVGAFLFRIVASVLMLSTKSLIPSMVMHAMVNGYLYLESEQLLSVGGA